MLLKDKVAVITGGAGTDQLDGGAGADRLVGGLGDDVYFVDVANDTVVEDLVAHRLEGLARALLVDVPEWREKSPLAQPVSETQEEVEDNDVHS